MPRPRLAARAAAVLAALLAAIAGAAPADAYAYGDGAAAREHLASLCDHARQSFLDDALDDARTYALQGLTAWDGIVASHAAASRELDDAQAAVDAASPPSGELLDALSLAEHAKADWDAAKDEGRVISEDCQNYLVRLTTISTAAGSIRWVADVHTATAKAGTVITIPFSLTNPTVYAFTDEDVRHVFPVDSTITCTPADTLLAVGESVACTLGYTVTADDVARGHIDVTVALAGTIPLGAGSPRATGVSSTRLWIEFTFSVAVVAGLGAADPVQAPAGGALAATSGAGADALGAQAGSAAALVAAGAFLLATARRRARIGAS